MKLCFIGDVHGRFVELNEQLVNDSGCYMLLGDVGLGFSKKLDDSFPNKNNLYFVRGNHDNPETCRNTVGYLGDFGYIPEWSLFYISGAFSIDKAFRTIGKDWWADEELSYNQFGQAIDLYREVKPKIVVSHDCPFIVYDKIYKVLKNRSSTSSALNCMFEEHNPELWFFGHHHQNLDLNLGSTRFIGLAELEKFCYEIKEN
jgi:hypothetical protein